jgi:diacylglycerol kinase family enzyme
MDYIKAKELVITQNEGYGCNVDGEILQGPGPFHIHVLPKLFNLVTNTD